MTGDLSLEGQSRGRAAMESLRSGLKSLGWDDKTIESHIALGYPGYWITFDTDSHLYHAHLITAADKAGEKLIVSTREDPTRGATEITVYTGDHPGLFSQIAGAMALSGVNIVDARIATLSNGMALDTFWVQTGEGEMVKEDHHIASIRQNIDQVLSGRIWLNKELPAKRSRLPNRAAVFKVLPRVIGDDSASRTHTVIEINGRDRPGLLYDLTSAMTSQGLQISSAHISTYGERVVDVFYVKDVFGHKVRGEKLESVRKSLLKALDMKVAS
jgi:[protein-PII] uridylyltransferase